jgi:hypothetical protein
MPGKISQGVTPGQAVTSRTAWKQWTTFCHSHGWDTGLSHANDPIPYFHLFARRWRDGRLAPKGEPTRARTAEDAIRQVGQAFSLVGADDPRLNRQGRLDYWLSRVFCRWKIIDGPSQ